MIGFENIVPLIAGMSLMNLGRSVLVLTGGVLLGGAWLIARRHEGPALRPFVVMIGTLGGFAMLDGLAAGNQTTLSIVWLGATLFIPVAFGTFVIEHYGFPYLGSWGRRLSFIAVPVLAFIGGTALILDPGTNGAMVGGGFVADAQPRLPGYAISGSRVAEQAGLYFSGGLMVAASGLLIRTVSRYEHLDPRLGIGLSFVSIWPWLAYMVTPGLVGNYRVDILIAITALGYVLSAIAVGFSVTRGGLFTAAPSAGTLGSEAILANLDAIVIVIDQQERIVRCNDRAVEAFELVDSRVSGRPLSELVDLDLESLQDTDTVELDVATGAREFAVTVTEITDHRERCPGYAIMLNDVTRQRVRAQRLTVLNRVLRHNLRNEMSNIIGRAEVISAETEDFDGVAGSILTSAEKLVDLGDRAQAVESMMSLDPDNTEGTAIESISKEVIEPYQETFTEATFAVNVPSTLRVKADERILRQVLDNLVENAIIHNDAPTPIVRVSANRESSEMIRIAVSDNGPGLPEQERATLEAGDESQLQHGSGLGLWAVYWGVTRMGGKLSFMEAQPRGTVVTIQLPSDRSQATELTPGTESDEGAAD